MRSDFFNEAILTAMLFAMPQKYTQKQNTDMPDGYSIPTTDAHNTSDDPNSSAITLRQKIMSLMDFANRAATMEGMPSEHVKIADFAASAFIDEILISSTTWQGRLEWMKSPLQYLRHNTAIAGEFFFSILNNLLEATEEQVLPKTQTAQEHSLSLSAEEHNMEEAKTLHENIAMNQSMIAVLEVYALCLNQGFEGMYYNQPEVIESYLQKIGMVVPTVNHNLHSMFFFEPQKAAQRRKPQKVKNFFKKFDVLDYILWVIPALSLVIFYFVLNEKLNNLLTTFLQGVIS